MTCDEMYNMYKFYKGHYSKDEGIIFKKLIKEKFESLGLNFLCKNNTADINEKVLDMIFMALKNISGNVSVSSSITKAPLVTVMKDCYNQGAYSFLSVDFKKYRKQSSDIFIYFTDKIFNSDVLEQSDVTNIFKSLLQYTGKIDFNALLVYSKHVKELSTETLDDAVEICKNMSYFGYEQAVKNRLSKLKDFDKVLYDQVINVLTNDSDYNYVTNVLGLKTGYYYKDEYLGC